MTFWPVLEWFALAAVVSQLVFIWHTYRNYAYAVKKTARKHTGYRPSVLLTVPCRGLDDLFDRNIASIYGLDYENYRIHFVVEAGSDPAHQRLCSLKEKLLAGSKALGADILVAGKAERCSQKIHNLLYSCRNSPAEAEVFAFADSDGCLSADWLSRLVWPLHSPKNGATTGYRWFVPSQNNLASLALSAINASVAQQLGNTRFNHAWGGSMAVRAETFRQIGIQSVWQNAIADDLSLSYAVRKNGMKVVFVPACLVASYESTNWKALFEFARRQFMITRFTTPVTWRLGLLSCLYSLAGLWAGAALAIYAIIDRRPAGGIYLTVPIVFFISQIFRAALRQKMAAKILKDDADKMSAAAIADILGSWLWSWALFICIAASAFGRTITWRGIRYKLIGPDKTVILNSP